MQCRCGTRRLVKDTYHVVYGISRSCGCLQREKLLKRNTTHGMRSHPFYELWKGMLARCQNTKHEHYAQYGGRGIYVCARWKGRNGFANFVADMSPRPPGTLLERRNNDGPYSPTNCEWATRQHQNRNKRNNVLFTYDGRTQCLSAWAEEIGINYGTLWYRLNKRRMSPAQAFGYDAG